MPSNIMEVGGLRSDTEERYAALKARLKEREIGGLLPVQAVPLVERLFDELVATQERASQAVRNHEQSRQEFLSSEQQLQPLKEDNVRLLHENNALHLELIHEAEREDEQHQQLQIETDKLKTQNTQLAFLNSQFHQKAEAAEAEAVKLRERIAELSDQLASGGAAAAAERKPRANISRPIAEAVPGQQEAEDSALAERLDLLRVKDAQLDKLEALVNATSQQNEALEADLRTVLQKVSARDQEIERLNQLLDGGQDYQKLSFEHVNKSNQQLVANLNENGIYCQTPHLDADLSRLPRALKTYWADNNIDGGVYPPITVLYLGSRVQLWADGTHRNIGWLYAHPKHQNRARCARPAQHLCQHPQ